MRPLLRLALGACLAILLLPAGLSAASFEEEYQTKLAAVDKTSADALVELGNWCRDQNRTTRARQHWNEALRLDKDHEGARAALGFVRQGDRWVAAQFAGPGTTPPAGGGSPGGAAPADSGAPRPRAAGPGPEASAITWDLTLPKDPAADDTWLTSTFIDRFPSVKNDSDLMTRGVATITQKYLDSGVIKLCIALANPAYGDLYGASSVVTTMGKRRVKTVRALLPFLMKASERVTEPGDLAEFCGAIAVFGDKRSVPRLLELAAHASKDVSHNALDALAEITLLPRRGLTVEQAKTWWDTYHATPDRDIRLIQLRDSDLIVQMLAAEALYELREPAIIPAIIRALRSDNRQAVNRASGLLERVTGPGTFRVNASTTAAGRKRQVDLIERWWTTEGGRFTWEEDRAAMTSSAGRPAEVTDPAQGEVRKLASITGTEAAEAETALRGRGTKAIAALLEGMESPDAIVRTRAYDILRAVSKQTFPFEPNGKSRAEQIKTWEKWAADNGHITISGGDDKPAEDPKASPGAEKAR